ncbi:MULTISPECIES: flagellar hook-basal body complex protein FliE [unclassified Rhizobium]|uniref:flagellar hook-basal body complex protein FliE n=1 Tax=unclassified Rhizobium TaxID=2613769 RepID=UPI0006F4E6E2|nr:MULTISPECIES: flagellar hook-basal body complex protein FliE [unclassified Rhizobium]KQV43894.1 flagellar hook-basal body protein FliE [Rhizobium sp. Root1212]KRD38075.1 flagellar hook-basal body protein FliE [Rhizobium sp. Root268]
MIDAISTISSAISAAKGITSTSEASLAPNVSGTVASGTSQSFASVMSNMASDMVNDLKTSEVASIQGIRGEANTREVIDAVMNAEQSLQTAIAIRDKVVTAYLEIARMPI